MSSNLSLADTILALCKGKLSQCDIAKQENKRTEA